MINNDVIRSVRHILNVSEFKLVDIVEILTKAGFKVSKTELSAFFRKEGHPNYRPVGDQFLRNFLKGLSARVRP